MTTNTFLRDDATFAAIAALVQSYIGGLALSNDATTPNSVLDIAAGVACDSTNAVSISIGAFTKSTAGAWASGSGSNGMGNGLTIANTTWYHVILANNGGTPDIYFDTSPTGANRPSGITDTKVRRIGSFKTDASAHILAFVQQGDIFDWGVPVGEVNTTNPGTSAITQTLTVPTGVVVEAVSTYSVRDLSTGPYVLVTPLSITDTTPSASAFHIEMQGSTNHSVSATLRVLTNTLAQVRTRWSTSGASDTWKIVTHGWVDTRGRFS